jgi:hypothetical protein
MDLRKAILQEHSKEQTSKIVKWVGDSQQRFDELVSLFLNDEYRVVQRAAWPLSYIVIAHPELIKKHLKKIVDNLSKAKNPEAVKRNTLRLMQHITIPRALHGRVMDLCFGYITSHTEKAAIKAFSLTILENLSREYPEIKGEVKVIIEDRWDVETPAFRVRARKFLNA